MPWWPFTRGRGGSAEWYNSCRVDAIRSAFVADKEVVLGHACWRNPEFKSQLDIFRPSVVEGADAAISACAAEVSDRVLS